MTAKPLVRILLVDDHPVVRSGLAGILRYQSGMTVVGEAGDGEEAIAKYREFAPDIVLMDLGLPGVDGWTATATIRAADPQARIIAISSLAGDEDIHRAFKAGAKAYLMKDAGADEIVSAVRAVMEGRRYVPPTAAAALAARIEYDPLSDREVEILRLIAGGCSNKEIGAAISVTESTVKWHVNNLLSKLGVDDRTAAVVLAHQRGILHL